MAKRFQSTLVAVSSKIESQVWTRVARDANSIIMSADNYAKSRNPEGDEPRLIATVLRSLAIMVISLQPPLPFLFLVCLLGRLLFPVLRRVLLRISTTRSWQSCGRKEEAGQRQRWALRPRLARRSRSRHFSFNSFK